MKNPSWSSRDVSWSREHKLAVAMLAPERLLCLLCSNPGQAPREHQHHLRRGREDVVGSQRRLFRHRWHHCQLRSSCQLASCSEVRAHQRMIDQKVKASKYWRGGWFRDRNLSLTYFICSVAASDLLFSVLLLPTQVGLGMFEKKIYHGTPFSLLIDAFLDENWYLQFSQIIQRRTECLHTRRAGSWPETGLLHLATSTVFFVKDTRSFCTPCRLVV